MSEGGTVALKTRRKVRRRPGKGEGLRKEEVYFLG